MVFEGYTFQFSWEIALMEWLQANIPESVISVISVFSAFGEELVMIAIMGFIYWCYNKELGRKVGVTICVGLCAAPMIKNIFFRRRPYFDNSSIKCLRPVDSGSDLYNISTQGYSFPSGHSTNSAVMYPALAFHSKELRKVFSILAPILCFLVGFSRVVVGCHYPTDVLCGWTLGLVVMFGVSLILGKIHDKRVRFAVLAIICGIGMFYCKTSDYFASYGLLIGFLLSEPFEEKFVKFEATNKPLEIILRVLIGGALYLVLNTVLKMPFSKEFLDSGSYAANLVRFVRYGIVIFFLTAIYPMLFKFSPLSKKGEK